MSCIPTKRRLRAGWTRARIPRRCSQGVSQHGARRTCPANRPRLGVVHSTRWKGWTSTVRSRSRKRGCPRDGRRARHLAGQPRDPGHRGRRARWSANDRALRRRIETAVRRPPAATDAQVLAQHRREPRADQAMVRAGCSRVRRRPPDPFRPRTTCRSGLCCTWPLYQLAITARDLDRRPGHQGGPSWTPSALRPSWTPARQSPPASGSSPPPPQSGTQSRCPSTSRTTAGSAPTATTRAFPGVFGPEGLMLDLAGGRADLALPCSAGCGSATRAACWPWPRWWTMCPTCPAVRCCGRSPAGRASGTVAGR